MKGYSQKDLILRFVTWSIHICDIYVKEGALTDFVHVCAILQSMM